MSALSDKLIAAAEHRAARRFEAARALLDELYAAHPDHAEVNYQYAWLCDSMGDEHAAVPYYERAIAAGLAEEDLRGAYLGLGSTYRCIGQYEKAVALLRTALTRFPQAAELQTFLAMALYNTGAHAEAMELLLKIAAASSDPALQRYQRAILFYADKLNETW